MAVLRQLQGDSPAIAGVRKQVERLLRSTSGATRRLPPILILGETGTGKGLLATAIHRAGVRAGAPFVDLNCAAIPETLLEAELFGYERGAFTDARQAKPGLFQTASGGTLFLDEIGLMPVALQSKLLKALEERSVRRLGSTRAEPVDVAVIAATSEDLSAAVHGGRFRPDLFHRLAVVTLVLPPLRQRGADIVLLAEHFLARVCEDYGLPAKALSDDARAALMGHDWPGNVRELANVLERATLLTDDAVLTARHLGLAGRDVAPVPTRSEEPAPVADEDLEEERRRLLDVLRETAWNFTRAAVRLGVPRNTLRYRVDRLGLTPESTPARRRGGRPPKERPAAEVAPPPAAPARETRRVALLQATLLSGDEYVWDADRALEAIAEKVRSFGGHVHEVGATELLAIFGREPEEDAPQRAAHAAIALQRLGARAREDDARRAELAIALHAASVEIEGDRPILDEPRHTLSTLMHEVEPATIVASASAARFLGGRFDLAPLETPGHMRAVRVVRHAEPGRTRFVGRERELRLLTERFELAQAGEGQVVVIVGEPGIGKSRLLHELRRRLGSRATWVEGQALAFARSTPFHALIDMLRRVLRIDDTDPETMVIEKIDRGVRRLAPDLDHVLPFVRYLLSVDPGDPAVAAMDPKQRHTAIVSATHLLLERGAALRTHVVVLEDVHWTDAATEDWLSRLAETISSKRVLVLVTARPGYRASFGGRSFHTGLALSTLSSAESVQIAESLVGVEELPPELKILVVDKAEGNPFFVEELMRSLQELAVVRHGGDAVGLGTPLDTTAVPDTIEEMILARMYRLDAPLQRLLQVAAVIGKDVPFALLRAVTGMPEDVLTADLRRLLGAEFLLETRMYPELEHTFKHALTHDVAYGALNADERRVLDARIVEAIEALYPARLREHVERLAHHAMRGELWPRAAKYSRQAGQKAFERSANREAVAWWEQALVAIARLPQRDGVLPGIDVRLLLRSPLLQLGELRRMTPYLLEAEALATAVGDSARLAWARAYITMAHLYAGEPRKAVAVGEQAVALGDAIADNAALRNTARTPLGHACREVGDYRRALVIFHDAIEAVAGDPLRQRLGQVMPPAIYARSMAALCHAELGELGQARQLASEAEGLAQPLDLPSGIVLARIALGYAGLVQEHYREATDVIERALAVVESRDVPSWMPWVGALRGYALSLSGRAADGVAILEVAIARAESLAFLSGHSQWVAWTAHGHLLAGRTGEAARVAAEAVRLSRERGERGYEAWALWVQGELGDAAAAAAALAIADELGMRPLVARCHRTLARLHGASGDLARARDHSARAATELGALEMPDTAERAAAS